MERVLPLIDTSSRFADGPLAPRSAIASGRFVRIRRGFYVPTSAWVDAPPHERFRTAVAAYSRANPQAVFCGETALFLHGIPVVKVPPAIDVAIASTTKLGIRPNTFCVRGESDHAQRARFMPPPPVRRHRHAQSELVTIDEFHTVPPAAALVEVLASARFARGLTVADGMLRRSGLDSLLDVRGVREEIEALAFETRRKRAHDIAALARTGAESPGESVSRALMHLFGFPEPTLQKEFRDSRGFIGRTDFAWDVGPGPVGEFDGWGKYFREELTGGIDPREVIRREKRRENRLLALGHPVLRWDWSELEPPELFRARLLDAGLRPIRSHGNVPEVLVEGPSEDRR
ncbi:hypothetical protein [Sinomonas sp. ASV322]|uniref:hypothetical protein n=1 Tax=Sinomonas sp. ASV322 TaxID=3041920 RepID=UPI0027DC5599|nr:hypothetical protein [Sinomonas sp. ASV322]MDQ4503799.1 hypothetical protein [Sinomonas sp. ASV322]